MSPDYHILACRHCAAKNKVPRQLLKDRPLCGKCRLPLHTEVFTNQGTVGGKRDKYLTYRGSIKAVAGRENQLVFVTLHAERQPTFLYRLDTEKDFLKQQPLPCGATGLAVSSEAVFVAGSNGAVFDCSGDGDPVPLSHRFETSPSALALLSEDRLAVMVEDAIGILNRKTGKLQQTLSLPENEQGTSMTADTAGRFLVGGTSRGTVMVFEAERQKAFQLSEAAKLHDGAVTALLFEKGETRFLSAGSDAKLLSTHVRGTLEAEDRGKSASHSKPITAMAQGSQRFYTGAADKTVKAWAATGRPMTLKEGVIKVTALTTVTIYSRPYLAAVCRDNSIRLFLLDDAGKPGEIKLKYQDAYGRAKYELLQNDPVRREAVLEELAGYNDHRALEIIARRITGDMDAGIRLKAATILADSRHPKAGPFLEGHLRHKDEAVRRAAFAGLLTHPAETPLKAIDLAFSAGKADVGLAAVAHLEKMAAENDQALNRLEKALNLDLFDVRKQALLTLERVLAADSPQADMLALGSKHWDIRRLALIRFFQRKMLKNALVPAALRNFMEDPQPEVRQTAFHLSLMAVPKLAERLRAADGDLHRQLFEIETFDQIPKPKLPAQPKGCAKPAAAEMEPLLKAMACRSTDICLAGGYAMALLGDARAFGLLMQLSRERASNIRSHVCRAFMHLNDPRGIKRLRSMIHDRAADVRDAAFSALAALYQNDPPAAVAAGFSTQYEDVRRRALDMLIRVISQNPAQPESESRKLMLKALNDDAVDVRREAFKAAFNLQMDGGRQHTLTFLLHSIHPDIRRNVLMEVLADKKSEWAQPLLTGFFDDPDISLRTKAFGYAVDKKKKIPPAVLTAGMGSQFEDVRLKSVDELVKNLNSAARKMLLAALNDKSKAVRQQALNGLLQKGVNEVRSKAFISEYRDIRCRAAEIAAGFGDRDALQPLVELLAEKEPEETEKQKEWIATIQTALKGLGRLGVPEAMDHIHAFLAHKSSAIRSTAIEALIRVSRPENVAALKQALKHADQHVRLRAALGLAFCGNPLAERLLYSKDAAKRISKEEGLMAAFILEIAGDGNPATGKNETHDGKFDRLLVYLDQNDKHLQRTAFLLLMLAELEAGTEDPRQCIACLAALNPKIRLAAAQALEALAGDFEGYITQIINEREGEAPWTLPVEITRLLGRLLLNAPLHIRVETLRLLFLLKEKKQSNWEAAWQVFFKRYEADITNVSDRIAPVEKPKYNHKELLQLAFGTYVGLIRDQSRSGSKNVLLNRGALLRIAALVSQDKSMAAAAKPVLIQTLNSPGKDVRILAFEQLGDMAMDKKELGAEALRVGYRDLGVMGLKLLMDESSEASGQALLENVMLVRKDGLELEAAKLLAEQTGRSAVSQKALQAMSKPLRHMAVKWLIADYNQDEKAVRVLRAATRSRYAAIRLEAALALGEKRDQEAFQALTSLLTAAREPDEQKKLVSALYILGDERTPGLLLDRLENDPTATADSDLLIRAAGNFRQKETFDRLMGLFQKSEYRKNAFQAMFSISGFDQNAYPINLEITHDQQGRRRILQYKDVVKEVTDPDFELTLEQARQLEPDSEISDSLPITIDEETYQEICKRRISHRSTLEQQYPRHGDLLVRLLSAVIQSDEMSLACQLINSAALVREDAVDVPLAILTQSADDKLRHGALEAVGRRLKFRKGTAEPLLNALKHKDPGTRFIAAEALAKAKRTEGIQVLLAAVDLMADLGYRRRAVQRLGELADKRAFAVLLHLADEDAHALQDEAMEAIGHMGKTDQADKIFSLLQRALTGGYRSQKKMALKGLRWLNTHQGWELIRKQAEDWETGDYYICQTAIELLGENNDPATIELLLRLIKRSGYNARRAAYDSARKILGKEALEPDYAMLQSSFPYQQCKEYLERVCEKGDSRRILTILHACPPAIRKDLVTGLLRKSPLPVEAALDALTSDFEAAVQAAAQIVGRAVKGHPGAKTRLASVLPKWMRQWQAKRQEMIDGGQEDQTLTGSLTPCLQQLIWAAGRHGTAAEVLLEAAAGRPDDPYFLPIRSWAVAALGDLEATSEIAQVLEKVILKDEPDLRLRAAAILSSFEKKLLSPIDSQLLCDRQSVTCLESHIEQGTLQIALGSVHYQGAVIPLMIKEKNVDALGRIAAAQNTSEVERMGAIEALAKIPEPAAQATLIAIGENKDEDEELRKCAWRALKRAKRAQKKAAATG